MQTEQKLAHTVEIAERLSILILYGIQLGFEWLSFLIRVLFLLGSMLLLNWVYFLERLMLIVLFYWNYNEIVLNSSHFNMLLMKKIVYLYIKFLTYFQYFLVISEKIASCSDPTTNLSSRYQTYESGPNPPAAPINGTVWNIICKVGYYWPDTSIFKTINCSFKDWIYPEACIRIF